MTRDELKDELQNIAVKRLEREKRLICQWATGVGKTNVALKFLKKHPEKSCLILVPEINNISNWTEEFKKFNVNVTGTVTIMCYASFSKQKDTNWDLLVFDEVPHVDTELRLEICNMVSGEYILALGAVIDENEQNSLESIYGKFDKSIITLDYAIEHGILAPPSVRILHLQLDNTEKKFWYKGHVYTAKERYDQVQRKVENAKNVYASAANKWNQLQMLRAGNERKRFLGELKEDALKRARDILTEQKKRFICFCSSIDQANKIGKDHAFTSKTSASLKLLERFNNHEIDSLFVVGKLIEGQNLNDIEVGVIGQLGGNERITVQSIGRVMRSQNPIIYVLVFDDTKDNGFLYNITANISDEYIKHYKF